MIWLAVCFAIAAAFLNAASAVLQREVVGNPNVKDLFRGHIFRKIMSNRQWFLGLFFQVLAFFLQAAAFYTGTLVMVAPILTSDLIFLMLLLHYGKHVEVGTREWIAVAATCVGLSGLLLVLQPHRLTGIEIVQSHWLVAMGAIAAILVSSVLIVRQLSSRKWRAGLLGIASGLSYAVVAACTKLAGHELDSGLVHMLATWPVYALIVAGVLSVVMQQNTYGAGPLAVSQPAMELTELLGDIVLGIVLFNEIVNDGPLALAGAICSGLVIMIGIVLLGGSQRIQQSKL